MFASSRFVCYTVNCKYNSFMLGLRVVGEDRLEIDHKADVVKNGKILVVSDLHIGTRGGKMNEKPHCQTRP